MIMSQEELEEPWGQLISTSNVAGTEEERVPVLGHKFLIGRDKGSFSVCCVRYSFPPSFCVQTWSWWWEGTGLYPRGTVCWREMTREGNG